MTEDLMMSAGVSMVSFLAGLILVVSLLMHRHRWLFKLPNPPSAVLRLRVIDPDGTERLIEFSRIADDDDGLVSRRSSPAEEDFPALRPTPG